MLEIRNVTKIYRSKTGEQVTALDNVSIAFPETGMVFILGKSGSGKSTLLNVIGGLDSYDSGEFVIMGKSSKDFGGSDFDAYRNTFIGFIFQEYNILDDFSVGANIGLALELQGKKATNEKINGILEQVDLVNYANRKPNELSGGQKQRIAIARALVKDPQIIMADEPTGALDSNTGKQIFDTLKDLSRRKLVLIVSHDRDFAERYADRIIELADGKIISDVTKHEQAAVDLNEGIQKVGENILRFRPGYQLTAADLKMINTYLAKSEKGVILSGDTRVNTELRSAAGLSEDGSSAVFEETSAEKDVPVKSYDGAKTKFIRSRLPMKNAVKMGSSGLKHKKFRLFMTILLSLVAFSMFGIADTMAAYNKWTTATRSIMDSNISNASFSLGVKETTYNYYDGKEHIWENYVAATMNDKDIQYLNERTGMTFTPVFNGTYGSGGGVSLQKMMKDYDGKIEAYQARLNGFVSMTSAQLSSANLTVTGRMPETATEIALPRFIYDQFKLYGFQNNSVTPRESVSASDLTMDAAGGTNSIIGKHISIGEKGLYKSDGSDFVYTIVGIVETRFDNIRYEKFLSEEKGTTESNLLADLLLQMELADTLSYGFHTLGFLTNDAITELSKNARNSLSQKEYGIYLDNYQISWNQTDKEGNPFVSQDFYRVAGSDVISQLNVTWLDGTPRTTLGAKEYLVSQSAYQNLLNNFNPEGNATYPKTKAKIVEFFGGENFDFYSLSEANQNALIDAFIEDHGLDATDVPEIVKDRFQSYLSSLNFGTDAENNVSLRDIRERIAYYDAGIGIYKNGLDNDSAFVERFGKQYDSNWDNLTPEDQKNQLFWNFSSFLMNDSNSKETWGGYSYAQVSEQARAVFESLTGVSATPTAPQLGCVDYNYDSGIETKIEHNDYEDYKLVGYFVDDSGDLGGLIINDTIFSDTQARQQYSYRTVYADHEAGIWAFAIAPMPNSREDVQKLVDLNYEEGGDLQFSMRNQVMNTLDGFNSFIEVAAKIFLYIGIGFAVFSALLLMNFISISISYKRHEIGILRAVGARSSDVFKIFFSEAFIIALINYVLALIATIVTITSINRVVRSEGVNVTLLNFGIRQFVLMFLISLGVAAIASFLPVWNIARRRPIDAIRNK